MAVFGRLPAPHVAKSLFVNEATATAMHKVSLISTLLSVFHSSYVVKNKHTELQNVVHDVMHWQKETFCFELTYSHNALIIQQLSILSMLLCSWCNVFSHYCTHLFSLSFSCCCYFSGNECLWQLYTEHPLYTSEVSLCTSQDEISRYRACDNVNPFLCARWSGQTRCV